MVTLYLHLTYTSLLILFQSAIEANIFTHITILHHR